MKIHIITSIALLLLSEFVQGQSVPCTEHRYEGFIPFCSANWQVSGEDSWARYIDIEETEGDIYVEVTLGSNNVVRYHITVLCVIEDGDGYEIGVQEGVFGYSSWTQGDLVRNNEHCPGEETFVDSPPELIRIAEDFIDLPPEVKEILRMKGSTTKSGRPFSFHILMV